MEKIYDVIIIGGGPAGYTAALYTVRAGFSTLLIEKMSAGGQMTQTNEIDNYPGFNEGIDGFTLGMKMQQGAERFGAQTVYEEVVSTKLCEKIKSVSTIKNTYYGKVVMIATGAEHRMLGIEDETLLTGRGVSYCATCDGMFYKGKNVVVVGGGNSAVADALVLSRIANKVMIVHRRDTLRATKLYHEQLMQTENVEFYWDSIVTKLISDGTLTHVKLQNVKTKEEQLLEADGLFVSIGRSPVTNVFSEQIRCDENGYIIADETTCTNIPGVYAIGDVRTKEVRQIVTAASDGAVAAHYAEKYLLEE